MSEKMICQTCLLPVVWYAHGWKHHPGPRTRVPAPGHKITAIPASSMNKMFEGVFLSEKMGGEENKPT